MMDPAIEHFDVDAFVEKHPEIAAANPQMVSLIREAKEGKGPQLLAVASVINLTSFARRAVQNERKRAAAQD